MTTRTRSVLASLADTIKNETTKQANTATRVGGYLRDLLDSIPLATEVLTGITTPVSGIPSSGGNDTQLVVANAGDFTYRGFLRMFSGFIGVAFGTENSNESNYPSAGDIRILDSDWRITSNIAGASEADIARYISGSNTLEISDNGITTVTLDFGSIFQAKRGGVSYFRIDEFGIGCGGQPLVNFNHARSYFQTVTGGAGLTTLTTYTNTFPGNGDGNGSVQTYGVRVDVIDTVTGDFGSYDAVFDCKAGSGVTTLTLGTLTEDSSRLIAGVSVDISVSTNVVTVQASPTANACVFNCKIWRDDS